MLGINGNELIVLVLLAVVILGPERLPEYAGKLARGIYKLRVMAEGAKGQLKEQLGEDYQDINWRQYDPRQYDPRRIVKQALLDPIDEVIAITKGEPVPETAPPSHGGPFGSPAPVMAALGTPWDSEST